MRKLLAVVLFAVSTGFCGVGIAHADGDSDYLAVLSRYGFDVSTPATAQMAVKFGHGICADLRAGASPSQELATMTRMSPEGISERKIGNMVSAAQFQLCPDTM